MIAALVLLGIALVALVVYWIAQQDVDLLLWPVGFVLGLAMTFVYVCVLSWPVMLLIGAAHSYYPGIPALGFWATFFLVAAYRVARLELTSK